MNMQDSSANIGILHPRENNGVLIICIKATMAPWKSVLQMARGYLAKNAELKPETNPARLQAFARSQTNRNSCQTNSCFHCWQRAESGYRRLTHPHDGRRLRWLS